MILLICIPVLLGALITLLCSYCRRLKAPTIPDLYQSCGRCQKGVRMYVRCARSYHIIVRTTSFYRWRAGETGARASGGVPGVLGTHLPGSLPNGSTTVEQYETSEKTPASCILAPSQRSVHQSSVNYVPGTAVAQAYRDRQ